MGDKSAIEWTDATWNPVTGCSKFLSLEPLLGPLSVLDLTDIDWVIVGGESGPGARPMQHGWVTDIRDQCRRARVPFFFKQWGGVQKHRTGRELDGRTWDEMPKPKHVGVNAVGTSSWSRLRRKPRCIEQGR